MFPYITTLFVSQGFCISSLFDKKKKVSPHNLFFFFKLILQILTWLSPSCYINERSNIDCAEIHFSTTLAKEISIVISIQFCVLQSLGEEAKLSHSLFCSHCFNHYAYNSALYAVGIQLNTFDYKFKSQVLATK